MRSNARTAPEPVFTGLRALAGCGGCAAKAPPHLVELLGGIASDAGFGPEVLAGLAPGDDAAVYRLDEHRALVATVDFFPPLVDDPRDFGAIAAANAVSDVYAMGGDVAFAMALSGFPAVVPDTVVAQVAAAASAVVRHCGGFVLGGHSIRCAEPVFGLCVLGFVHPRQIWRKSGVLPGDTLALSKPLGTGLLLSQATAPGLAAAVASMRQTNREAAASLRALPLAPHAVTDVSGFGFVGHLGEMLKQSGVSAMVDTDRLPLLPGALAAAQSGARTSAHRDPRPLAIEVGYAPRLPEALRAVLIDPQTSGGLLVAVDPSLTQQLESLGFTAVGTAQRGPPRIQFA